MKQLAKNQIHMKADNQICVQTSRGPDGQLNNELPTAGGNLPLAEFFLISL
jgi:hypothetical protein